MLSAMVALLLASTPAANGQNAAGPIVIPLHVVYGPEPRLGVDVVIGDKPIRVLLDTGSAGLRLLATAVTPASVRHKGDASTYGYGSGLVLNGEDAAAHLAFGAASGTGLPLELVDGVSCREARPDCPAANGGTPEMFGRLFAGILGAGTANSRDACCANPLPLLANGIGKRYIVHAALSSPAITLNPDATALSAFTMVDLGGNPPVPTGCVNVNDGPNICGDMIFDTGSPQLVVFTSQSQAGLISPGSVVTLKVGQWSHRYTVGAGNPPLRPRVVTAARTRIVVGLAALQEVDVLYDFSAGRIGLR